MQPFKEEKYYQSMVWPELQIEKKEDHLLFRHPTKLETISSAVYGGGWNQVSKFVNWKVPIDYSSTDPSELMTQKLAEWGYPVADSLGLQTAAFLHIASIQEMVGDEFRILCCVTAGVGNAARAGKKRKTYSAYQIGTINTFIFIDSTLSHSAMVNGIITATEAKAAALQDLNISDEDGDIATGTTTDSVVLAVSQNNVRYPTHQYAGVATTIGNAIASLVYDATHEVIRNL